MASAAEEGATAPRNVMVSDRLWEAVRLMAFEERVSMSEIVRDALEAHKPLKEYLTAKGAA